MLITNQILLLGMNVIDIIRFYHYLGMNMIADQISSLFLGMNMIVNQILLLFRNEYDR